MKGISLPTATMTSKGQITIPIKIRKAMGLKPGARLDFYEVEDGEYAFRAKTGSIMEMAGCFRKFGYNPSPGDAPTIEEMDRAVLAHASRLDAATRSDAHDEDPHGETA